MSMTFALDIHAYRIRSTTVGTFARTLTAQLIGGGQNGNDDSPDTETVDGVEVMQPLGLFARPFLTEHTEAFAMELGDELVVLAVLDKSGSAFATDPPNATEDVAEGETRLYGAKEPLARIRLRADGSVAIQAKPGMALRIDVTGAGDVVLNGGTLRVARETDTVSAGTGPTGMAAWITAVTGVVNGVVPGTVPPGMPSNFGAITSGQGAPHVKA